MPKNSKIIISDDPVKKMKAEKRRKKGEAIREKRENQAKEIGNRKQEILGMFDEKAPRKLKVDSIKVPNFCKFQKAPKAAKKSAYKIEDDDIENKDSYNFLSKTFVEIKDIEKNINSLLREMGSIEEAKTILEQLEDIKNEAVNDPDDNNVKKDEEKIENKKWYQMAYNEAKKTTKKYQKTKTQLEDTKKIKHEYLEKINNYVKTLDLKSILCSLLKLSYEDNRELSEMLYQNIPNKDKLDISQPIDSISKRIASIDLEERKLIINNLGEKTRLLLQESLDTNQQTALISDLPLEEQQLIIGSYASQPVEEPPAPALAPALAPAPAVQVSKMKQAGSATQNKFYDESSGSRSDFF